jgi:hypothetical protein
MHAKLIQRTMQRRINWPNQRLRINKYGVKIYFTAANNTRYSTASKPNGNLYPRRG